MEALMRLRSGVSAMVMVLLWATTGLAQIDRAQFAGTVRDSSGAFVSGAVVTVKNQRTGEERTTTSADAGTFLLSGLKPSVYTVRAAKDGFAPVEYTDMPLAVGQELHIDFEFKPAGVQESVTVVGSSPVLDLSSARIGVNVSPREVEGLPVNGRQMSQLLLQAPGSQNAGDGTWQDIRFSGRANEQNVIKYDGIEGSAIHRRVAGQRERREPDAVQAAGEPRERAGVPRRIEQLSRRIRHRHGRPGDRGHQVGQQRVSTARSSSTSAARNWTRGITSMRCATTTTASARRGRSRS
jgi:hypothetical protein